MEVYTLAADPAAEDVPQSYAATLSAHARRMSRSVVVVDGRRPAFVCRLYYVTRAVKATRCMPSAVRYELADVYMYPSHRGRGLAASLLRDVLRRVGAPVSLWVDASNAPALALYRACGFEPYAGDETWVRTHFAWLPRSARIVFMVKY